MNSRPERQREILRKSRKNMARPNNPEKAIGEILSEVGIKCKFLQDVSYRTLDNKPVSKEMDIVWKDSMGNKKIIEYNGRFHFDPREHKPEEIHDVHNKPTKCQDIWDKENMILKQIRKEGWKILVVWQLDFLKELDKTTKKILKFAKS
jgi:G:T-mismatch repair DNA endonuclease (very short patch repair protein)